MTTAPAAALRCPPWCDLHRGQEPPSALGAGLDHSARPDAIVLDHLGSAHRVEAVREDGVVMVYPQQRQRGRRRGQPLVWLSVNSEAQHALVGLTSVEARQVAAALQHRAEQLEAAPHRIR